MRPLMWLLCALCATPALAIEVRGTVVDQAGSPVAGAAVAIVFDVVGEGGVETRTVSATSGPDGAFSCPVPDSATDREGCSLLVRAAGYALEHRALGEPVEDPLVLRLSPVAERTGRVTCEAGAPLAGVTVRLAAVEGTRVVRGATVMIAHPLPSSWAADTATTTDADGRYALRYLAAGARPILEFAHPAYGTVQLATGHGWDLWLPRAGRLRVRLTGADGKWRTGVGAHCCAVVRTFPATTVESDLPSTPDGAFEAPALPPGAYRVELSGQPDGGPQAAPLASIEVRSGETTEVEMAVRPLAAVRGRLVAEENGAGIGDQEVTLSDNAGLGLPSRSAVSGGDGSFEIRCLPGTYRLWTRPASEDPATTERWMLGPIQHLVRVAEDDVALGSIVLRRGYVLRGRVVDASGAPVPTATVAAGRLEADGTTSTCSVSADDAGCFDIGDLPAGAYQVNAAAGPLATARGADVQLGPGETPVTLTVVAGVLCSARVRVVDGAGAPIPGVAIEIGAAMRGAETSLGVVIEHRSWLLKDVGAEEPDTHSRTGADGVFTVAGLAPDRDYTVTATMRGLGRVASAVWQAERGDEHDFGDLVLPRSAGTIEGTVRDTAGRAVEGATVTAVGPGSKATTDAEGRFSVARLTDRPQIVVVQAPGRLAEAAVYRPGNTLAIVLEPEAPPACLAAAAPSVAGPEAATERALVAGLLLDALRLLEGETLRGPAAELAGALALLDPAAAESLVAELGLPPTAPPTLGNGEVHALNALSAALVAMESTGRSANERIRALVGAAETLRASHPDSALRCLQVAASLCPQVASRSREEVLDAAKLGALLLETGDAAGAEILSAAGREAATLGNEYQSQVVAGQVGARLCALDPDAGLRLVEGVTHPQVRAECLRLAVGYTALAGDVARAAAMAEALRGTPQERQALLELLPHLDSVPAPQAEVILRGIPDPALALARAATRVEASRRASLLARAADLSERLYPWWTRGAVAPRTIAAEIACLANHLGYSQSRALAARALVVWAERPPWVETEIEAATLALARPLIHVAPDLALALLEGLEAGLDPTTADAEWPAVIAVTAELDPARAVALARAHLGTESPSAWARTAWTLASIAQSAKLSPEERAVRYLVGEPRSSQPAWWRLPESGGLVSMGE